MDRFVQNLRVLWRVDSAIADIRMRHALARSGLNAVAALIAVFGLLMLELSAYFILLEIWNAAPSALVLGLINFAVAAVIFLIAARRQPGRELELANEIHKTAMDALQADARLLQAEVASLGRVLKNPLDTALPALVVPLASLLLRTLRKSKGAEK